MGKCTNTDDGMFICLPADRAFSYPGNFFHNHITMVQEKNNLFNRSCKIGSNTLLGYGTKLSDNVQILHSVLGNGCSIGANVAIKDSYLWDDVVVESSCTIEQCIIGRGAKILKGSVLSRGSLVGDGVILGPNAKLEAFTRVSRTPPEDGEGKCAIYYCVCGLCWR